MGVQALLGGSHGDGDEVMNLLMADCYEADKFKMEQVNAFSCTMSLSLSLEQPFLMCVCAIMDHLPVTVVANNNNYNSCHELISRFPFYLFCMYDYCLLR